MHSCGGGNLRGGTRLPPKPSLRLGAAADVQHPALYGAGSPPSRAGERGGQRGAGSPRHRTVPRSRSRSVADGERSGREVVAAKLGQLSSPKLLPCEEITLAPTPERRGAAERRPQEAQREQGHGCNPGSHHLPGARGGAPQNPRDVRERTPLHPASRSPIHGLDAGRGGLRGRGRGGQLWKGPLARGVCAPALAWPPSPAVAAGVLARIPAPVAPSAQAFPRRELGTALGEAPLPHITALTARAPDPVKHHGSASFHPNKTAVMNRGSCRRFPLLLTPRHCAASSEAILHPPHPCVLPHSTAGLAARRRDGMLPNPERSPCRAGGSTAAQLQLRRGSSAARAGDEQPPQHPHAAASAPSGAAGARGGARTGRGGTGPALADNPGTLLPAPHNAPCKVWLSSPCSTLL